MHSHCLPLYACACLCLCVCVCVNLSVEKWSPVSAVWLRLVWFALVWFGLVALLPGFIINVVACRVRCLPFHCVQTTSECVPVCVCVSVCVRVCDCVCIIYTTLCLYPHSRRRFVLIIVIIIVPLCCPKTKSVFCLCPAWGR